MEINASSIHKPHIIDTITVSPHPDTHNQWWQIIRKYRLLCQNIICSSNLITLIPIISKWHRMVTFIFPLYNYFIIIFSKPWFLIVHSWHLMLWACSTTAASQPERNSVLHKTLITAFHWLDKNSKILTWIV